MNATMNPGGDRTATRRWVLTLAQAATGAYFFVAGLLKLAGAALMVHAFARWGMGAPVRIAVGLVELACGVALVFPRTARYAAWTLLGLTSASCALHVAHLDSPVMLLEPMLLGFDLVVLVNATSHADYLEDPVLEHGGGGGGGSVELHEHRASRVPIAPRRRPHPRRR